MIELAYRSTDTITNAMKRFHVAYLLLLALPLILGCGKPYPPTPPPADYSVPDKSDQLTNQPSLESSAPETTQPDAPTDGTLPDFAQYWPVVVSYCKENEEGYVDGGQGPRVKYKYLIANDPRRWSSIQVERRIGAEHYPFFAKDQLFTLAFHIPWKPTKDLLAKSTAEESSGETEYLEWLFKDKSDEDHQILELQFRYKL